MCVCVCVCVRERERERERERILFANALQAYQTISPSKLVPILSNTYKMNDIQKKMSTKPWRTST